MGSVSDDCTTCTAAAMTFLILFKHGLGRKSVSALRTELLRNRSHCAAIAAYLDGFHNINTESIVMQHFKSDRVVLAAYLCHLRFSKTFRMIRRNCLLTKQGHRNWNKSGEDFAREHSPHIQAYPDCTSRHIPIDRKFCID